ncbi:MBOAT family O-acyltransferase [Flexithrix dorotheae]|uniref:MBOAT family O-acyltransferase n=1 Tax=Flexithrix dorotheae TaxID=70993 RepID=UPI00036E5001|nr:MBOAT family O-acyltransferase [Flexithrix dorotheae]
MLFNSLDFAIFLPIVFILYWFVLQKSIKYQNSLIVIASYVFYGWWDWRFLSLIIFSTCVDYFIGWSLLKKESKKKRKILLWVSVLVNIGFLGFFKYFNFFLENFTNAFSFFGVELKISSLNIILPVGISFYTFQTLSYTIDVYKGKLEPTKDFIAFAAFVSFFPQLVAGPIERATNLLSQFFKRQSFSYANSLLGLRQIIWGLFKKIVIADNCAQYANEIFNNYQDYSSLTLLLGAVYFSFQIYGDFSGYSDIAIGTARLFGFKLMKNFAYPYFSRDIAEFWRRWHISLSTWFRDYLYIPLGGSRGDILMKVKNVFIIFIVSGFWHGANWTFIIWGALNAIYFLPLLLTKRNRRYTTDTVAQNSYLPSFPDFLSITFTYFLTVFAWIFFRSESLNKAYNYIIGIFHFQFEIQRIGLERYSVEILPLIFILLIIEWNSRNIEFPLSSVKKPLIAESLVLAMIIVFGNYSDIQSFIYFQF